MGGLGHEEAKRLSWWEYTALQQSWNKRHSKPGSDVKAPTGEKVRKGFAKLAKLTEARPVVPKVAA